MNSPQKFTHKSYYELLGIKPSASPQEIERAFRDIARIFDPESDFYSDIVSDPPKPHHLQIFLLARTAHEVLTDAAQRKAYDVFLKRQSNLQNTVQRQTTLIILCVLLLAAGALYYAWHTRL